MNWSLIWYKKLKKMSYLSDCCALSMFWLYIFANIIDFVGIVLNMLFFPTGVVVQIVSTTTSDCSHSCEEQDYCKEEVLKEYVVVRLWKVRLWLMKRSRLQLQQFGLQMDVIAVMLVSCRGTWLCHSIWMSPCSSDGGFLYQQLCNATPLSKQSWLLCGGHYLNAWIEWPD